MPSRRSSAQKITPPPEPAPPYDPPEPTYEVTDGDKVRNWEERLSAILEDHQLRVSENVDIQCLFSPNDDEMRAVRRAESRFPATVFDVLRTLEHSLEAFWAWKQSPRQRPAEIADRPRNRSRLRIVADDSLSLWVSAYNWIAKLHSAVQSLRENLEGLPAADECSQSRPETVTDRADDDSGSVNPVKQRRSFTDYRNRFANLGIAKPIHFCGPFRGTLTEIHNAVLSAAVGRGDVLEKAMKDGRVWIEEDKTSSRHFLAWFPENKWLAIKRSEKFAKNVLRQP